ncbi:MAG: hypothetical protein ISS92_03855 [Candidatus Omnitrophica bacterium]|nr:hypothetical protein [Candidatus Omnitrophota bacterium]
MSCATHLSQLIKVYGKNVMISRVNGYNIIHLDNPTDNEIKQRIKEVLDGQIDNDLEDDCSLCQTMKGQPYDIVYYKQGL